jgi:putative colanic acid biosynthesis acetyltransferase WcaF
MNTTQLNTFNNSWYNPGNKFKRAAWFAVNALIMQNRLMPFISVRRFFLRLFGAKIGKGVVIKPNVNVKYPWKLIIGDYCWIGEQVWIDNLGMVKMGNNVCVSQGALLLCGNHNYKRSAFDLIVGNITLEDGVWIGTKTVVCPGVTCCSHSLLTVGSIATSKMEAYTIYQGNPAVAVKERIIKS